MTDLTEILFPAPAPQRTAGGILKWWEQRRLHYNAIVGATGLFSWALINLMFWIGPSDSGGGPPWVLPIVFGIAANIFYFMGPAVEVLLEKLWGRRVLPTGPTLFRMGLTFSVGLTLLPIPIAAFDLAIRILKWIV